MRLFLVLVVLLMVQYKTFGQQILIKEDFEFYWPMQQYDIEGDWSLEYPAYNTGNSQPVGAVVGRSRALKGPFTINIPNIELYDSIRVEVILFTNSATNNYSYWNNAPIYGLQISSDGVTWECPETASITYGYVWNCLIDTQTYPYIRLHTVWESYLDNLLVVGYSDIPITNCQFDSNQDGAINVPDLIDFLSWYGTIAVCD